jgi:hypothetical protein
MTMMGDCMPCMVTAKRSVLALCDDLLLQDLRKRLRGVSVRVGQRMDGLLI